MAFFSIALIFSYVQLFAEDSVALRVLLRWYIFSFVLIAGFGILQFTLPLLGMPALLVTQWWIPGFLPRVNGFSYEPSYFATYLLIGFVFVSSLRNARSPLLSRRALAAAYWVLALGIVLSSSRMGIVFLLLEFGLSQGRPWAAAVRDFVRLRISRSRIRALAPSLLGLIFVSAIGSVAAIALERNPMVMLMFLNGTGISDTAAHSVLQREGSFEDTLQVFGDHPFIGRSLGGVSSAIANLNGETVHSFEESKAFEGMSVFAEALAGSGVFGVIPFIWFLIVTIREPLAIARSASPFHSAILHAFVRSLVFSWAILQVNQNILRPYLWVHLAMLATICAAARKVDGMSGNRRLAENIAALSLVQFLNYVAPLVTVPYLVRILHPAQFGLLSFSQGIVLCFCVITDYGFDFTATRAIAANRDHDAAIRRIAWTTLCAKLLLLCASACVLALLVATVPKLRETPQLFAASFLYVLGTATFPRLAPARTRRIEGGSAGDVRRPYADRAGTVPICATHKRLRNSSGPASERGSNCDRGGGPSHVAAR